MSNTGIIFCVPSMVSEGLERARCNSSAMGCTTAIKSALIAPNPARNAFLWARLV